MRGVGVLLSVTAACYAPQAPRGVACGPGDACPAGQTCVAGFCDGPAPGSDASGDGPPGDGTPLDAPIDGPPGGFGTPQRIAALSGMTDDFAPSISEDGLTIYFNRQIGTSDHKLFVATRTSTSAVWETPVLVAGTDGTGIEYDPDITVDGNELYFVTEENGDTELARATPQAGGGWSTTVLSYSDLQGPSLCGGDLRGFISTAVGIEEWSRPSVTSTTWTMVRTHDTLDDHEYPGPSQDCLEMFTTRNGKIYRATRPTIGAAFGMPSRLMFGGVWDTTVQLIDPELSHDGSTLYLSVDIGGSLSNDIYVTTR